MKLKPTIFILLIFSTSVAVGQRHPDWSKYYLGQMYTGLNDTLYYGFDWPDKMEKVYEHPLMVWLTNNAPNTQDTFSLTWVKYLSKNKWVTINPYLESTEQWNISVDTTIRARQLKALTDIFIGRNNIIDTSIMVCGYNQSGIMAMIVRKHFPNTFRKAVVFIDNKELLKKGMPEENIVYVIPKQLKRFAIRQKLKYILVNGITEAEIIRISNDSSLL
ncbi:MAG: hypothetical protein Q8M15_04315 [Bacteroidota bacterium]|nr:hypothetical protein [Bacteroidota bacterium]